MGFGRVKIVLLIKVVKVIGLTFLGLVIAYFGLAFAGSFFVAY